MLQGLKQLEMWELKTFWGPHHGISFENIKKSYHCLAHGKVTKMCRGWNTYGLNTRPVCHWVMPLWLLKGDLQLLPNIQDAIRNSSTTPHYLLNSICFWVIKSSPCKSLDAAVTPSGCRRVYNSNSHTHQVWDQFPWSWACPRCSARTQQVCHWLLHEALQTRRKKSESKVIGSNVREWRASMA